MVKMINDNRGEEDAEEGGGGGEGCDNIMVKIINDNRGEEDAEEGGGGQDAGAGSDDGQQQQGGAG